MPAKATKGKKITCEVCNKPFVAGYIGTHKRVQHGIYGGRSGRVRGDNAQLQPVNRNGKLLHPVEGFVLLQDSDGGIWIAEKIK